MDINDFIQYKDKFTENAFVDKVSKIAKRAGSKLVYAALVLYYTLQSDKVSLKDKAIIIGALGYLVAPIDAMPDIIPIAGLGDDLAVLLFVLEKVWGDVTDDIKGKAKAKLAKWFDDDEIVKAEDVFTEEPQDIPV
ncbi:MAG: DUF1232 domain-containing protein [Prevotella sp.]|jgi:uncharacterized membrane protein YkvA (DUF1232 family)|nr:DUF1232 domain-containing protein [Prevotella sp.]MBQ6162733.1 DUF1232 domain-containing protein [Prevotella sp.]MBQ6186689.1 DUF1232 domain-containing protein [Prevotella sp.]